MKVFPLHVPPLRERRTDIAMLAEHFVRLFARRMNKTVAGFTQEALNALTSYHWPGNVRELTNVIERAMIVCETDTLGEEDLALIKESKGRDPAGATFEELTRHHILQALKESDGVIEGPQGAASRLGFNPATLRSKMKRLGISRNKTGFIRNQICRVSPKKPEIGFFQPLIFPGTVEYRGYLSSTNTSICVPSASLTI